jgi:hypothetical protein
MMPSTKRKNVLRVKRTSKVPQAGTTDFDKLKVKSVQQGRAGFEFDVDATGVLDTVRTRRFNPHFLDASPFSPNDLSDTCVNSGDKVVPLVWCNNRRWQRDRYQSRCEQRDELSSFHFPSKWRRAC